MDTARIIQDVGDYGIAYARELASQLQEPLRQKSRLWFSRQVGICGKEQWREFLAAFWMSQRPLKNEIKQQWVMLIDLAQIAALIGADEARKLQHARHDKAANGGQGIIAAIQQSMM